ncbi:MAG TPA: polysaccharide biosynthesis C-terminal domain-containing protein [Phycisphaerae bacterium]|nr:polysaccharide biosynthesis C-terminal domain-containing protein [Phycisphaerae bacterium]
MATSLSKRLFAHGGVYSLAQIANQAMVFLLLPIYARVLPKDAFGVISLMGAVGTFLGLLFIQGLHGAWYRLRFDEDGPRELRSFEATIIWYLTASVAVGLALVIALGHPLARWVTHPIPFYPLGLLTAIYAAATVYVTLLESKLQAEQRPIAYAIFSGARTLLTFGLIILLVVGLHRGAPGKILADAISAVLLAAAAWIVLRPAAPRRASRAKLRRALAYAWPLVPHNMAALANDMIDRVLVNSQLGLAATGVYTMGYRIGAVGLIVATALNRAYGPLFITSLKEVERCRAVGEESTARRALDDLAHASLLTVAVVVCISLGATAVAREALMLIAPTYHDAWQVVAIVAAGIVAWACYFPFSQPISYDPSRVRLLAVITISAAVINIAGNLVLIPHFQLYGAAWATFASSSVLAVLALWIGRTSVAIPFRWRRWQVVLLTCFAGLTALWWMDGHVATLWLRLALKLAVGGAAAAICIRAAGVRWADIQGLRRRKVV